MGSYPPSPLPSLESALRLILAGPIYPMSPRSKIFLQAELVLISYIPPSPRVEYTTYYSKHGEVTARVLEEIYYIIFLCFSRLSSMLSHFPPKHDFRVTLYAAPTS